MQKVCAVTQTRLGEGVGGGGDTIGGGGSANREPGSYMMQGCCTMVFPPPACVGQYVLQRYGIGCCRLLAVMSSLRARYHTKKDVALSPCKRRPCPCSDAFLRSVKKHWLGSFSIVLPPSGLRGFVRAGPLGAGGRCGNPGPETIYGSFRK